MLVENWLGIQLILDSRLVQIQLSERNRRRGRKLLLASHDFVQWPSPQFLEIDVDLVETENETEKKNQFIKN